MEVPLLDALPHRGNRTDTRARQFAHPFLDSRMTVVAFLFMESSILKKAALLIWVLSYTLLLPGLALGQTVTAKAAQASSRDSSFRTRLKAAAQLYEELEYEQALKTLTQAKALATTDDERADAAMYEAIVLADLGKRSQSLRAFHEALSLQPDSQLPVRVSPKVARDFEDVRQKLQGERVASAPVEQRNPSQDRPVLASEENASAVAAPAPTASLSASAEPDLMTHEPRDLRIRPLPVALLGAGVLAGGLGSYFGLRSRSDIQSARDTFEVDEQMGHLDAARGKALGANILFGVAATAAAGAVITYFLGDEATVLREAR
ncbi:tetratricopeptide repeat protein [Myxococcus sp. SDU36]|uniref:tetratricopeptide repeat protein n=1 Tax=Myxococcus sp. SDU36 TaxID=2831967 RepID=UPI002542D137|nr:tetratricopeptide repeat protein [Myxococcus sp. SDU36]WIG96227.1 tetratricopeptide repeat protein [Myxococcus sp. SDU36]